MDLATKYEISTLLESYQMPEVLSNYYPSGVFGFDREGCPVCYEALGRLDFKGILHSVRRDEVIKSRLYVAEVILEICREQSMNLGREITQAILLYDMEGLGTAHTWKPGVQTFNAMTHVFEALHPDLWKHVIVIKAPKIFPVVYSFVKPFLAEKTKRKILIFGSNWMTEIRKYIDPSQLPEYYGGECKDDNSDPMCKSKISYGGQVPSSYYKDSDTILESADFLNTTVRAGSVFVVEKDVNFPETVIRWEYRTLDHDIGFSVDVQEKNADGTYSDIRNIVPFEKKSCNLVPEESALTCDNVGKYFLKFDNSYSWTRSKKVYYQIILAEPEK